MIFDHYTRSEPIVRRLPPSLLPTQRAGKYYCDATWFQNPDLSGIPYLISNILTKLIPKTLILNFSSDFLKINNHFKCSQFSACEVTAWISELVHQTSTEENMM